MDFASGDLSETWANSLPGGRQVPSGRRRRRSPPTGRTILGPDISPASPGHHGRAAGHGRHCRTWWATATAVLIVLGTLGAFRGADALALNDVQRAHQIFVASSRGIATTLRLAILHEEDLSVSTGAFFAANPDATEAQFLLWTKSVQAFSRYPELLTISVVEVVQASELGAYGRVRNRTLRGHLVPGGTFVVIPPAVGPTTASTRSSCPEAHSGFVRPGRIIATIP